MNQELTITAENTKGKYIEYWEKDKHDRTRPGRYRIGFVVRVDKYDFIVVDYQRALNKRIVPVENVISKLPRDLEKLKRKRITFIEDNRTEEAVVTKVYKDGFTVIDYLLPHRRVPQEDVIGQITGNFKRTVTWQNQRRTPLFTKDALVKRNHKLKEKRNAKKTR